MAIASVLLAFVAFVSLGLGLVLTLMPVWGAVFSFGAPVLALIGVILSGLSMSEAKKRGDSSGLALAGVIMNVAAFIPAFVVAMTCGLCNACVSAGGGTQRVQWNLPQGMPTQALPSPADAGRAPPPFPTRDAQTPPPTDTPRQTPPSGAQPPPSQVPDLPPPPLAPGPSR